MPRRRSKHREATFILRPHHFIIAILLIPVLVICRKHQIVDDNENDKNSRTSSTPERASPRKEVSSVGSTRPRRDDRNVIVSSIRANNRGDLENLCRALGSLTRLPDHGATPVLVYATDSSWKDVHQSYLRNCTQRKVSFPKEPSQSRSFWISQIFMLDSVSDYDTIMRLDSGACWKENSDLPYLPGLPNSTVSYHAGTDSKVNPEACGDLMEFASNYIVENHVLIQNTHLWYDFEVLWTRHHKCTAYQTHFEVMRIDLMKQDVVQDFLRAAMKHNSNWDDSLLRSFTVVMFAPGVIPTSKAFPTGYSYSVGRPGASCKSLPGASLES